MVLAVTLDLLAMPLQCSVVLSENEFHPISASFIFTIYVVKLHPLRITKVMQLFFVYLVELPTKIDVKNASALSNFN